MFICIYISLKRRIPVAKTSVKNVRHSSSSFSEDGSAIQPVRSRSNSAVRFREDSDIDDNLKRTAKERCSEDDDCVAYKNVDPKKQKEHGIVKRNSRLSAQEAAKRLKRNFDVSSDDE